MYAYSIERAGCTILALEYIQRLTQAALGECEFLANLPRLAVQGPRPRLALLILRNMAST